PYNSIQAINNVIAMKALNTSGVAAPVESANVVQAPAAPTEPQIEVRRAEPVRPMEHQTVVDSTIKLDRPPPVDF
ncbi:MAG TPA: hypothetical protein VEO95_02640, partial [Chthoniobacteraceae bacterium]|nr:hypothetical protein [Chthoniobacteraceae bacterium]